MSRSNLDDAAICLVPAKPRLTTLLTCFRLPQPVAHAAATCASHQYSIPSCAWTVVSFLAVIRSTYQFCIGSSLFCTGPHYPDVGWDI